MREVRSHAELRKILAAAPENKYTEFCTQIIERRAFASSYRGNYAITGMYQGLSGKTEDTTCRRRESNPHGLAASGF